MTGTLGQGILDDITSVVLQCGRLYLTGWTSQYTRSHLTCPSYNVALAHFHKGWGVFLPLKPVQTFVVAPTNSLW